MSRCLHIKLDGAISGYDLPVFNELVLTILPLKSASDMYNMDTNLYNNIGNTNITIKYADGTSGIAYITGPDTNATINNSKTLTLTGTTNITYSNTSSSYCIHFTNKNNITSFNTGYNQGRISINLSNLTYMTNLTTLHMIGCTLYGNFDLTRTSLVDFNNYHCMVDKNTYINTKLLPNNMQNLRLQITGNIDLDCDDLAARSQNLKLFALSYLNSEKSRQNIINAILHGDVTPILLSTYPNGPNSAPVYNRDVVRLNMRFNANAITSNYLDSNNALYMRGAAVYGNIAALPSNLKILVCDYTESEIAANWPSTTARPYNNSIPSLHFIVMPAQDIANMLINLSNCTGGTQTGSYSSDIWVNSCYIKVSQSTYADSYDILHSTEVTNAINILNANKKYSVHIENVSNNGNINSNATQ